MSKINKVDKISLGLLILLSLITVGYHLAGSVVTVNNYAGFVLLILTIILRLKGRFKSGVVLILLLSTLDIVNFFFVVFNGQIKPLDIDLGIGDLYYSTIGFNPMFFIFLAIYCLVNFDYIKSIFTKSDEEEDKMISFYYDKFSEISPEEYQDVLNQIDRYPEEAQIAIKRIELEKV